MVIHLRFTDLSETNSLTDDGIVWFNTQFWGRDKKGQY